MKHLRPSEISLVRFYCMVRSGNCHFVRIYVLTPQAVMVVLGTSLSYIIRHLFTALSVILVGAKREESYTVLLSIN